MSGHQARDAHLRLMMTVRHHSRKSEHMYLAWHCGAPLGTLYSQVGVFRNCRWAMANDSHCRILFCSRMRLSHESFRFLSKDSRLQPFEWFQSQTIDSNTGNRKEVDVPLPLLPSVTDKLPPDAPILLRHTASRGRFHGRCSSGILTVWIRRATFWASAVAVMTFY